MASWRRSPDIPDRAVGQPGQARPFRKTQRWCVCRGGSRKRYGTLRESNSSESGLLARVEDDAVASALRAVRARERRACADCSDDERVNLWQEPGLLRHVERLVMAQRAAGWLRRKR